MQTYDIKTLALHMCGLLVPRWWVIIISEASQLSRQHCSLTACLQTLDHLVLLSTSGLLSQYAGAFLSISRALFLSLCLLLRRLEDLLR